jgi:hypothetical protein
MNVLATKFVWEQTEGMEQDSFVITIRRQSLSQLGEAVKSDYLLLEYPTEDLNDDNSKNKKRPKNVDFVRIAFVELFKNESFKKQYDAVFGISHVDEQVEDESEEEQEVLITDNYVQGVSSYYGLSNVDRLLYLSPKFFRIDLSKELDQRLLSSDREQTDLHNRTERLSKMAGIDLIMLDKPDAENRNTEIFNDFSQIQDWIREESLYNGRCFYSFSSQALPQIRETYGTDYLGINYVSHFTERNPFNGGYLILSLITFYPLPLYLYWQLKPLHNLEYNFAVFDLKEGDIGFYDIKSFSARYKKGTINAHLYNSFNQLNRQR